MEFSISVFISKEPSLRQVVSEGIACSKPGAWRWVTLWLVGRRSSVAWRQMKRWQPTAAVAGQEVVSGCCTVSGRNKREAVTRDCGIA